MPAEAGKKSNFSSFRPGQREAAFAILHGQDVFVSIHGNWIWEESMHVFRTPCCKRYSGTGLESIFWQFLHVFIHISFIIGAGALKLGRDVQTLSHYTCIHLTIVL